MALVGKKFPNVTVDAISKSGENQRINILDEAVNKQTKVLLFWYPKDFTFVCPTEIKSMNRFYDEFQKLNAEILGVSTDSEHSHKAWIKADEKDGGIGTLSFPIGADTIHKVSKDYGVYIEEDGAALRGLFIIDPEGVLRYAVVHDLNVGRSAQETLRVLQALRAGGLCPADWAPGEDLLTP